jgi:hypothetical protein
MSNNQFPPGWNDERVKSVLKHYESQSDDDAVAEDEAAYADTKFTFVQVPIELVPQVQGLINAHIQH